MIDIKGVLLQWFIIFWQNFSFDCQSETLATWDKSASGGAVKNENTSNQELVEELHKLIVRKIEKPNVQSSFTDNAWGADLPNMQLISKFNKRIPFSSYVINIFSKYTWVIPVKDKKDIAFQKRI